MSSQENQRGGESSRGESSGRGSPGGKSPSAPGGCPGDESLRRLLSDDPSLTERVSIERHLGECRPCVGRLEQLAAAEEEPWQSPADRVAIGKMSREMLARVAQAFPAQDEGDLAGLAGNQPAEERVVPQIPGFSDLEEVGRGATGIVYRAFQEELGRTVAIKLLSAAGIPGAAARVHREAMALARLQHPAVVAIHGTGDLHGVPYLVMEWISGGTLEDRLARGPLPPRDAASVVWQLAQGVGEAHAVGLVHRDLKPANVLLQPGEPLVAKLTDFGLARELEPGPRLTATGVVLGTPSYMAPEQTGLISTLGEVGPACDLYGLGAVAYASLVGDPPHEGRSTLDTLVRVAWEEPESLTRRRPEIPRDLATIVSKCLRTHPGDRYRSAGDLADDLERFLEGRPISARPYSWTERGMKWARRHPAWAAATGLLALLLVGGMLGTAYHVRTLNQTLQALEAQRTRAARADEKASSAMASEQVSRAQTVDQLLLTTQITRLLLERSTNPEPQDDELLVSLRHYFHEQGADLAELPEQSAEALGLGLSNLAYLEGRGARLEDALEDTRLVVAIADRFPQSTGLQDLRLQVLEQQRSMLEQLGRADEAAQSSAQLVQAPVELPSDRPTARGQAAVARSSALIRAGRRREALRVIEAALPLQESAARQSGRPDRDLWRRWLTLLSTQGGLQQELGELSDAAETLEAWQRVNQEFVGEFAAEREAQEREQSAILIRQIELDIGTGKLTAALMRIEQVRGKTTEVPERADIEIAQLVELAIQEIRVRAMQGHSAPAEPVIDEVVARLARLRGAQPAKFELAQLQIRALMSRAGLHMLNRRPEMAVAEYQRVISLVGEWEGREPPGKGFGIYATDSHWLAAQASEAMGDMSTALDHLWKVLEKSHTANRNAVVLKLVVVHLRQKDLAGARRVADLIRNDAISSAEAMRLIAEGERRFGGAPAGVAPPANTPLENTPSDNTPAENARPTSAPSTSPPSTSAPREAGGGP